MDHDLIAEQLLDRCKGFIEHILQASDHHRVATASLAIFAQVRDSGPGDSPGQDHTRGPTAQGCRHGSLLPG